MEEDYVEGHSVFTIDPYEKISQYGNVVYYNDIALIKGVKEKRYIHVSSDYDRKRDREAFESFEKWESP